jgi:pimeloyl-ACP methyl ester carboxylesterase
MRSPINVVTLTASALALAGCSPSRGDARQLPAAQVAVESLLEAPDQYYFGDGVGIRYRIIGEGEPVLLLHGYTDRVEMWAGTADSLAEDFRVIVPDIRGFGLSSKFGHPSQYGRKMVEDLAGLLDFLDVDVTHVLGYSMGAVLAAHLALDDPARVRTVTLVAGPFFPDPTSAARVVEPFMVAQERGDGLGPFFKWILPTWTDSAVNAILPPLEAVNDSASLIASMRAFPALMIDSLRLKRARTPALAIVSVKDRLLDQSRFVARWWPGARLVELPRGDHADIFLAPELLVEFRDLVQRTMTVGQRQ